MVAVSGGCGSPSCGVPAIDWLLAAVCTATRSISPRPSRNLDPEDLGSRAEMNGFGPDGLTGYVLELPTGRSPVPERRQRRP